MFTSATGMLSEHVNRFRMVAQCWRSWGGAATAIALLGAGALMFDAMTPQIVSVGIFYVSIVLVGFWFPNTKAALALALLATPLIIVGYWIAIPDNTAAWEGWMNRALAVGTVWMTGAFVYHIRVLEQKLQVQTEIANSLSREIEHRVGNHLQLVAAFLRLQAKASSSEQSRHALELAGSRVMTIGGIQRMLSHSIPSHTINSKDFITAIIGELRSTLPNPEKVDITVHADSAELTSIRAIMLGALLTELINNAVKHAFLDDMNGTITVNFTALDGSYIVEFRDDGVGTGREENQLCFGTTSVTDLARLMGGSIAHQAARQSDTRPGTMWRLVIPA